METIILLSLLLTPLFLGTLIYIFGKKSDKDLGGVALIAALVTIPLVLYFLPYLQTHDYYQTTTLEWIGPINIGFGLRVDSLSLVLLLAISFLSVLSILYSLKYVKGKIENANSYYACMVYFMGGMIGVALATDMIQFYLFWELVLVTSFVLVAFWGEEAISYRIGIKYFFYTHLGAVLILIGILWIFSITGTTDLYAVKSPLSVIDPTWLKAIASLFIIGFSVKMAIFPFHSWLPDAYTIAQLPVTIMLAAIMVSIGAYGLVRFLFTFFEPGIIASLLPYTLVLAVITQYYGGLMALTEKDIKRILGYSSVSQMGYMFFGICTAIGLGVGGSIFHIINHGIAKALLFMVVGLVAVSTGTRNIDKLGGLARKMPLAALACTIGAFSIAGAPFFCGFQSEWMMLSSGFGIKEQSGVIFILSILAVCASLVTTAYCLWFVKRIFFGEEPKDCGEETKDPSSPKLIYPTLLLSIASIIIGIYPSLVMPLVKAATELLGVGI